MILYKLYTKKSNTYIKKIFKNRFFFQREVHKAQHVALTNIFYTEIIFMILLFP